MTHAPRLKLLRFYLTAPAPCPYLDGKTERKVFTPLVGDLASDLNEALTHIGFRRSQTIAYRPACENCSACYSVRVVLDGFSPTRSQKRVMRRNQDLIRTQVPAEATREQFELLRTYLETRHPEGGMAEMSQSDFATMVQDTSVDTSIVEYREPLGLGGQLRAFCLMDKISDGLSMVYSAFDTSLTDRSLGLWMILDHLDLSRKMGLDYVYLGYWIEECQKMSYKARFTPLEILGANGWELFDGQVPPAPGHSIPFEEPSIPSPGGRNPQ